MGDISNLTYNLPSPVARQVRSITSLFGGGVKGGAGGLQRGIGTGSVIALTTYKVVWNSFNCVYVSRIIAIKNKNYITEYKYSYVHSWSRWRK